MIEEIWKPIKGFEEWYQVSNTGKIRSCARRWSSGKWREVGQFDHKRGYKAVLLKIKGTKKYKNFLVHRLVADAFLENGSPDLEVNHIDGNKHNNNVENLEWCTQEQNREHAIANNLYNRQFIARHKVLCIETGKVYGSTGEASKDVFGDKNHRGHIGNVCRGERLTAGGYHFKYVEDEDDEQ